MQSQNLINVITDALPGLNKSETKVAQVILSDPDAATQSSIATLARKAVSPALIDFVSVLMPQGFQTLS
jgi:DNA-binding MurR/RpiR family transcriptional regulator